MFEVYINKNGEYMFRLKARNGQIIAISNYAYASEAAVYNAIASVMRHATDAEIINLTTGNK